MSPEVLRQAAGLMRERAEGATGGAWVADGYDVLHERSAAHVADCFDTEATNAEHIASWHPAVALAVAEWLEAKAEQDDKGTCDDPRGCCNLCEHDYGNVAALVVARAYLGGDE